ncbi:MAG: hypothetical protein COA79_25320 [Planctomycetota bacterium]|nr:MAG: hypothetical protein COA79_25320 [Planctomycetota bacterium]
MIRGYFFTNLSISQLKDINDIQNDLSLKTRVISDNKLSNSNLLNQKKIYQELNCQSYIIHLDINIPANKNKFIWSDLTDQICFALDNIIDEEVIKINLHFLPQTILSSTDDFRKYLTDCIASIIEKLDIELGKLNIQHFDSMELFDQSLLCIKDLNKSFQTKLTLEPGLIYQSKINLLTQEGKWSSLCDMILINEYSIFNQQEIIPGNGITPFSSLLTVLQEKQEPIYTVFYPKKLELDSLKSYEIYFNKSEEFFLKSLMKFK